MEYSRMKNIYIAVCTYWKLTKSSLLIEQTARFMVLSLYIAIQPIFLFGMFWDVNRPIVEWRT